MGAVTIDRVGKTAVVTINRPEASNALNTAVWTGLADAWNLAREDDDIWTVVVTGAGSKAFCAGADLKETNERKQQAEREGRPFTSAMPLRTPMRGIDMPKPVIAAINGVAAGGGMELALACDIRIAAEHVRMGLPEVARGLIPAAGGCTRLPRLIPFGLAMQMLCTGELISAQEAYRIGLVNQVVPAEALMSTAMSLAGKINENAPLSVRAVKEGATASLQIPLSEAMRFETLLFSRVRQSEDSWEGPKAFSEKRKPVYRGR